MKPFSNGKSNQWLIAAAVVLLCSQNVAGEIINAYEYDLKLVTISINNLEKLIASQQTLAVAKNSLIEKLASLKTREAEMQTYYLKTAIALAKLKAVDPVLFDSINFIKDKKGNITHVYVKIVPEGVYPAAKQVESTAVGYSLVTPSEEDADIAFTKYGIHTAYVEVQDLPHKSFCYSDVFLLAHEFGHLIYEVPNLAAYSKFYHATYNHTSQLKGHHWNDPSGKTVDKILKSFLRLYRDYKKETSHQGQSIIAKLS